MCSQMEQTEFVEFIVSDGLLRTEIHERLKNALRKSTPSISSVFKWITVFKSGLTRVKIGL